MPWCSRLKRSGGRKCASRTGTTLAGVSWQTLVACGLALLWPAAAVLLWLDSVRQRRLSIILLGAMPVVAITAYIVVHYTELRRLVMLLFNAYLLILGVSVC